MAQIINIPNVTPAYMVTIAAEYDPTYDIRNIGESERKLICITASNWTEAEKLRDKAQHDLRKAR